MPDFNFCCFPSPRRTNRDHEVSVPLVDGLRYSPLKKATSIRLLQLLPRSSQASAIVCSMEEFDLIANAPIYHALSYTWGPPTLDAEGNEALNRAEHQIVINHVTHSITGTLYAALAELSFGRKSPYYIWIDALCINQNDNLEKKVQVLLMGKIYSQADQVIV